MSKIKIKKKRKRNARVGWSHGAKYWMAVGTLAACTATGGATDVAPVQASRGGQRAPYSRTQFERTQPAMIPQLDAPARLQALPAEISENSAQQGLADAANNQVGIQFHINPGPLEQVVEEFERQSGVKLKLRKESLRLVPSPGVSGFYSAEAAMQRILAGTGLTYRLDGASRILLDLQTASTTVDVVANAEDVPPASLMKYTEILRDTPQSISVVSHDMLEQQGTTTLRDALRNIPGISLAAGEGGAQGDNLTIRGFSARDDLFIDGMRDFGSYYRDPFNMQEAQVLQGPSSVTFGRGSTGGVVNQVSKTPKLNRFFSGEAEFGTDLTRRGTLDFDVPIPQLGKGAAFRVNAMGDEGNVAGRDVAENRRYGVAPSLALGLGTPTRLTFSYFFQSANDIPDYGVPWLFHAPAPVPHENYYGFRNGNYLRTDDHIGTVSLDHEFNSHVAVHNQVRYADYARDVRITEPKIVTPGEVSTPLSDMVVNRNELAAISTETFLDDQLDVTANFNTGFIRHTLVTGVEGGRETSDPTRLSYANVPTTSLLHPDPDDIFAGAESIRSQVHALATTFGAYVVDTLKFGERWALTAGMRWDRFDSQYREYVGDSDFSRVDAMPTWRAALVYKPDDVGSIYFSYGTSFNPSAESLSLRAGNANLPPEQNRSFEAGTKWDLPAGLSLRAAVFRTEKTDAREPDPANPLLNVLAGDQRVDGIQFEARGRVNRRMDFSLGYALLDSEVVNSEFYRNSIGIPLANVPRNTFTFWTSYQLPAHWNAGIGGNYVSSRTASSTAPWDPTTGLIKEVPGYWVFNTMAQHPLAEHIDFQINLFNIADRYYYDQLHPGHIVLGPGRSATMGLKFKF